MLDSPLLAYFKPEGDEDLQLQGTNLKERFYSYLVDHPNTDRQVPAPPEARQTIISCSNCSNLTCHPSGRGADLSFLIALRLSTLESFILDSAFFNSLSLTELAGVTVKLLSNSPSGRDFHRSFDSATCRTSTISLPT